MYILFETPWLEGEKANDEDDGGPCNRIPSSSLLTLSSVAGVEQMTRTPTVDRTKRHRSGIDDHHRLYSLLLSSVAGGCCCCMGCRAAPAASVSAGASFSCRCYPPGPSFVRSSSILVFRSPYNPCSPFSWISFDGSGHHQRHQRDYHERHHGAADDAADGADIETACFVPRSDAF